MPGVLIPTALPLAIPSYVFTYTWVALIPDFSGFFAAVFILSITTLPYVILATLSGLRTVDSSQLEVARSLGVKLPQVFRRVVFPQVKGHISAGALLSGLYVLSRQARKNSELATCGDDLQREVGHIGANAVNLPVN